MTEEISSSINVEDSNSRNFTSTHNICTQSSTVINIQGTELSSYQLQSAKRLNEIEWNKTNELYRYRMQRVGFLQVILALICIIVTFVITTFEFKESPATGIWCSVFFAAVGGLVHTASKMNRSFRVVVTFGVTNIYFGFLMFFVEFVETGMGRSRHKFELRSLEMVYHIVMCIFALFQVLLTIFAIWICRKHDGAQIKQRSFEHLIASCNQDDETVAIEIR